MAVDKMKLLARYKELKAQGVSISLTELKAQMESETGTDTEVNTVSNVNNTCVEVSSNSDSVSGNLITGTHNLPVNSVEKAQDNTETVQSVSTPSSNWNTTYSSSAATPEMYSNSSLNSYNEVFSGNMTSAIKETKVPYTGNISTPANIEVQDNTVKKFALIGYPLGHSLSQYIHNAGFKSLGLNASYEILETTPEKLVDRIKFLKFNNYSGFNVTIPLKLPVTVFLDEVDDSAGLVNAVNTVVINPTTKELIGYNTDVIGFKNAIPEDVVLYGKTAGVLGTGGAARAAITALVQSKVSAIKLYTRNVPNSIEFLQYLRTTFPSVEFNSYQIERIRDLSDVNILVNTTPIGMLGRAADLTPVEERELCTLPQDAVVYDVIYNPKKTLLLKLAQKHGYRTINGVDMFIHQALAAEKIWTGQVPDFKDMKIAALENL